METTNAILLRKRKLSDTSLIISWCTESLGCLETVARGARRPKSVFAGKLDLFFEVEIQLKRSRKSNLHTLTEAVVRNPYGSIRESYPRTQTASCFVEWIELTTAPEHPAPELFHLLQRAFGFLDKQEATPRALKHFEAELARFAGVHDAAILQSNPAAALATLFGRMPRGRNALLTALAAPRVADK